MPLDNDRRENDSWIPGDDGTFAAIHRHNAHINANKSGGGRAGLLLLAALWWSFKLRRWACRTTAEDIQVTR
jgi:hypothetical protein